MNVYVARHAIKQYRYKVLRFTGEEMTDEQVSARLADVVRNGRVRRKMRMGVKEYYWGDLSVAAVERDGMIIVVTCLGDTAWYNWHRRQSIGATPGRLVHLWGGWRKKGRR